MTTRMPTQKEEKEMEKERKKVVKEEKTMPKLILEHKFLLKKEQLKLRMSLSKARCPIVQEALKKRLDAVTQQLEELDDRENEETHFLRAPELGIICCIMHSKTDPTNSLQNLSSQNPKSKNHRN